MVADLVEVVAAEVPASGGRIAVHRAMAEDLASALRDRLPGATFVDVPENLVEAHVVLAAAGPFDVVVDRPALHGRARRFKAAFFHVRAGGIYLVPGAAGELSAQPGPLGQLLTAAGPDASLGDGRERSAVENLAIALRHHVSTEARGAHLLVSHDLPDVRGIVREEQLVSYLELADTADRVLEVLPPAPPLQPPSVTEGPIRRSPDVERPINPVTLSLRVYHDVVVAPRQVVLDQRVVFPDTYRHGQAKQLGSSQLVGIGDNFAVPRFPIPEELPRLEGTHLYFDNEFRGHFGHLITESVSREWTWPRALEIDPDVRVLVGTTRRRPELQGYELELYEAAGIPRDRIELIRGPVRVSRLVSGTQMFGNPMYAHPGMASTWTRMGDELSSRADKDTDRPKRVFLARRTTKRACLNAGVVESIFAEHGFVIAYPEDLSVPEQVALMRAAEVVGGYAGSALFSMAFVPEPSRIIVVTPSRYRKPRNEYLIAALHGHSVDYVVSASLEPHQLHSDFVFDVENEGRLLREILAGLG